ncbi:hypothetical protein [uncultured Ruegeria sp.]|uniref:hypothetical protein n=1 Tax=uncultured Ruegeria sp. TaxID=259304 RepID=UPI002617E193|nr:hypothetical protein [uncultured Ruegeria sp.]
MYKDDLLLSLEKTSVLLGCSLVLSLAAIFVLSIFNLARNRIVSDRAKMEVSYGAILGLVLVFGCLAGVIGLLMGSSRTAAAGNVLPVALTFIGGLAMFLITKESSQAVNVSASVLAFSLMLLFGTVMGSYERARASEQADLKTWEIERQKWLAQREFAINAYRNSLGLKPMGDEN